MSTHTNDIIRISEIFGPTIQGEGALIGQPTVFVRTGGCDYRCSWCDTLYAVESRYRHDWKPMSSIEIMYKVSDLSGNKPLMISLSGGNPATQNCAPLLELGRRQGYGFCLETQGSIAQDWFRWLDILTLSPKPPSSGMQTDWDALSLCIDTAGDKPKIVLKIPVLDEADYEYAKIVHKKFPALALYLQPVNHTPDQIGKSESSHVLDMDGILERNRWLIDRAIEDKWYTINILPQLHVLLWGNERGV